MSENDKVQRLIRWGYKVEIVRPKAKTFLEKYRVYKDLGPAGKKTAIIDEDGLVMGEQG